MANRVIIRKKYRPPEAEQARAAKSPRGVRRQFLAKVVQNISAATFSTTTGVMTLGTGTVTPLAKNVDSNALSVVDESAVPMDVYNCTAASSADADTKFVVVWVMQSDIDGKLYFLEPCDSFDLQE